MNSFPLAMNRPQSDPASVDPGGVRALAVFRALQLGDMLCAVPALRALRARVPAARITLVGLPWAQQFSDRFAHYIDDFVAYPGHWALPEQPPADLASSVRFARVMGDRCFDLAIQMHGSGRVTNRLVAGFGAARQAGFHDPAYPPPAGGLYWPWSDHDPEPVRWLRLATRLGAPDLGVHLEFPLLADDERELAASGVGAGLEPGSFVCIHPGARSRDKCWPVQCFAEVADRLAHEFGLTVVLTGSAKEADLAAQVAERMTTPAVDATRPLSIGAMAALMGRSRLLICNDTGVSHIAAGLCLPSVVVFGKADMRRWSPLNRHLHRCIWDPLGREAQSVLAAARMLLRRRGAMSVAGG